MDGDYEVDKVNLKYIRRDGQFYTIEKNYALAFYELLTNTQEIASTPDFREFRLHRDILNMRSDRLVNQTLTEIQRQVYFLLSNMNEASLNFYPMRLAESYISNSGLDVDDN